MKYIHFLLLLPILACAQHPPQDSAESAVLSRPFFQASKKQPYHISVGAVLFNEEGLVACHHFQEIFEYKDIYILMRESMEDNETPLMTLHRGLQEEFGATATPIAFLGSLSGYVPGIRVSFEKTTLYIACRVLDWDVENRDALDPEASSTVEWIKPDILMTIMEQQGERFPNRGDLNEAEIVRRALPYILNR